MAEETLLAQVLREPALLEKTRNLQAEEFSAPLLAKVYSQLRTRYDSGLEVRAAVLEDLSAEESAHIALVLQRQEGNVSDQVVSDCVRTIQSQHQASQVHSEQDLLAMREQLKQRKGYRE